MAKKAKIKAKSKAARAAIVKRGWATRKRNKAKAMKLAAVEIPGAMTPLNTENMTAERAKQIKGSQRAEAGTQEAVDWKAEILRRNAESIREANTIEDAAHKLGIYNRVSEADGIVKGRKWERESSDEALICGFLATMRHFSQLKDSQRYAPITISREASLAIQRRLMRDGYTASGVELANSDLNR